MFRPFRCLLLAPLLFGLIAADAPESDALAGLTAKVAELTARLDKQAPSSVFNVLDYGADPTGLKDSTAAIQACIDAALGDADPKTVAREAKGPIYLPAGKYRITKPLRIWSAQYLKFHGDGASTHLIPVGKLDSILDLNGIAYSTFEDFLIRSPHEDHLVQNAIYYYWDPKTACRSSMRNVFARITIQNTRCVTGMRVGMPGAGVQVDQTAYRDLNIEGNWWGPREPGLHLNGIVFGDGVFGNCLVHSGYNLEVGGWETGIVVDATNFGMWGGSFGYNTLDLFGKTHAYLTVQGVRSESSGRFFLSIPPSSNVSLYHFSDIIWSADRIAPDGEFMRFTTNGNAVITNLVVPAVKPGVTARIAAGPPISSTLRLSGIACQSGLDQFLAVSPKVTTVAEGLYQCSDAKGQVGASEGLVTSGPVKAGSVDLGGGRAWNAAGFFPAPGAQWTADGLRPGGYIKWDGSGGLGPGENESLRYVGWSMDKNGNRRAGFVVPPLKPGK